MILERIYTTPEYLFEPVKFKTGINYIFGRKIVTNEKESRKPLNGIGKSTLLDLIDFVLLSSFSKGSKKRIKAAFNKGILKDHSVVLEFRIGERYFAISRSFDEPSKILFSQDEQGYKDYSATNLKPILCDLIFHRSNYSGKYSESWLRQLLPFFIKIQPPLERGVFVDPIKYIEESNELKLNQFHFFLLNINNRLANLNLTLNTNLSNVKESKKNLNRILQDYFKISDRPGLANEIRKYKNDISKLSSSINVFKLHEKYKVDEEELDKLTDKIKSLWLTNHNDKTKLKYYEESYNLDIDVNPNSIKRIYSEFNELLGENVKKTLKEAIQFKKKLIGSRKDFISSETNRLSDEIVKRTNKIEKLDNEKSKLLKILESKKAIKDLSSAYTELTQKQEQLNKLSSHNDMLFDLSKKETNFNIKMQKFQNEILDFKKDISDQEDEFAQVLSNIYNALYPSVDDFPFFDISIEPTKDAKFKFNVLNDTKMFSSGRNQGRTLIYDLAVLFNAIDNDIKMPRFLIHDGIFDGMDKSQFIALVEFLEEQKQKGKEFQYIITLNEEGELKNNFGSSDLVNPAKIESEAIIVLTPDKHLFNSDF